MDLENVVDAACQLAQQAEERDWDKTAFKDCHVWSYGGSESEFMDCFLQHKTLQRKVDHGQLK